MSNFICETLYQFELDRIDRSEDMGKKSGQIGVLERFLELSSGYQLSCIWVGS